MLDFTWLTEATLVDKKLAFLTGEIKGNSVRRFKFSVFFKSRIMFEKDFDKSFVPDWNKFGVDKNTQWFKINLDHKSVDPSIPKFKLTQII